MRTLDFSPLFRSTVGFDRLERLMDSAMSLDQAGSAYPPYNIESLDENSYRISMAVAGFGEDDLNIEVKEDTLTVSGKIARDEKADQPKYLHRGIANRAFERRFQLADHIRVVGASLVNGLLHVELVREVPESAKPRTISIGTTDAKALENKKAA
ncbi:MAG: Hsp20 family protein [Magnetospiraceae bacterium]